MPHPDLICDKKHHLSQPCKRPGLRTTMSLYLHSSLSPVLQLTRWERPNVRWVRRWPSWWLRLGSGGSGAPGAPGIKPRVPLHGPPAAESVLRNGTGCPPLATASEWPLGRQEGKPHISRWILQAWHLPPRGAAARREEPLTVWICNARSACFGDSSSAH